MFPETVVSLLSAIPFIFIFIKLVYTPAVENAFPTCNILVAGPLPITTLLDRVVIPDIFNDEIQVTLLFNLVVPDMFILPELNIVLVEIVFI